MYACFIMVQCYYGNYKMKLPTGGSITGTRKFFLAIFYGIMLTAVIITGIIYCKPTITDREILAIGFAYTTLLGAIIWGYRGEYSSKINMINKEGKDEAK